MGKLVLRSWEHPNVATASRAGLIEAAARIEGLSLEELKSITSEVPLEWGTTDEEMSEVANILFLRIEGVVKRLRQAAAKSEYQ